MDHEPLQFPRTVAASGAMLAALFLIIYPLRMDSVIGLLVDDAWYVLLAKAIASGDGYTLINAPTPGIHPAAPPAFPALLAVVWLLHGEFPANLWLLKAVSMAAMAGVGIVAFLYFRRNRGLSFHLALGIAGATVFYPALVFMATATVMSECVYTFIQILAICAVETCAREDRDKAGWRTPVVAGALASAAFLTRAAGAGLIVAAVVYLLWVRRPRQALALGAVVVFVAGAWVVYARTHAPTPEERAEQASSMIIPYNEQFWQRTAGNPADGTISAAELPTRVWKNLSEIARYDIGAVVLYGLYRSIEPGRVVLLNKSWIWLSLILTALAAAGFIAVARERLTAAEFVVPLSLSISALWGWEQFRFLLPLIPFLIFYLLMGVRAIYRLLARFSPELQPSAIWIRLAAIAWVMAAINVFFNFQFIHKRYAAAPGDEIMWYGVFAENAELLRETNARLEKDAIVATTNPALVYLFTGHRTVSMANPVEAEERWKRAGVRYMVFTANAPLPPIPGGENRYRIVYRQPGRLGLRVLDLNAPSSP